MIIVFAILAICIPLVIFVIIICTSINNESKKRQKSMCYMGNCLININDIIENKKVSPDTAIYLIKKELRELERDLRFH